MREANRGIDITVLDNGGLALATRPPLPLHLRRLEDGRLALVDKTGNAGAILLGFGPERRLIAGPADDLTTRLLVLKNGSLALGAGDGVTAKEPARLIALSPSGPLQQWQPEVSGLRASLVLGAADGKARVRLITPPSASGRNRNLALAVVALVAVLGAIAAGLLLLSNGDDETPAFAAGSAVTATSFPASVTATAVAGPAPAQTAGALVQVPAATATSQPAPASVPTSEPAQPTQATAPSPPPAPTATTIPPSTASLITAALPEYAAAVRTGNNTYVLDHLHPIALSFYGPANCQSYLPNIGPDPSFSIQLSQISGPASWTWVIYNQTVGTVPDAYTLNVTLTQRGQTVQAAVHFAWNGRLQVFSPCIPPPA